MASLTRFSSNRRTPHQIAEDGLKILKENVNTYRKLVGIRNNRSQETFSIRGNNQNSDRIADYNQIVNNEITLENMERMVKECREDKERLRNIHEIAEISSELSQYADVNDLVHGEIDTLLNDKAINVNTYERILDRGKSTEKYIQDLLDKAYALIEEVDVAGMQDKVHTMKEDVEAAIKDRDEVKNENYKQKDTILDLQQETGLLQSQLAQRGQVSAAELAELQAELRELNVKQEQTANHLSLVQDQFKSARSQITTLTQQVMDKEKVIGDKDNAVHLTMGELTQVRSRCDELRNEHDELSQQKFDEAKAASTIDASYQTHIKLREIADERSKELQKKVDATEEELVQLRMTTTKIPSLEMDLRRSQDLIARNNITANEKDQEIASLGTEIRQLEKQLQERTSHAEHMHGTHQSQIDVKGKDHKRDLNEKDREIQVLFSEIEVLKTKVQEEIESRQQQAHCDAAEKKDLQTKVDEANGTALVAQVNADHHLSTSLEKNEENEKLRKELSEKEYALEAATRELNGLHLAMAVPS